MNKMLEGLAAWVFNTYVGEYLENLNTDQLSIGLLRGAVELENLPLKRDALKKFDLPLEVKAGFVGKIGLHIPLTKLRSEPWVITIDKLYLVAGPLENDEYNDKKEDATEQAAKQAQLSALDKQWRDAHNVTVEQDEGYGASWWSVGTSLTTNIMENLQLRISDVHIRYENSDIYPGHTLACGITISALSAQSTDENWEPKFVTRDAANMMLKLVELQDFSIYWDTNASLIGDLSMPELTTHMQRPISTDHAQQGAAQHEYILQPVSAQAKLRRNCSVLPLRSRVTPRITCDLVMDRMQLNIGEPQYRSMIAWMKEYDRFERSRQYRRWRPVVNVKDSAATWWKFCMTSVLHTITNRNRRCTKNFMLQRARTNVQYVHTYANQLSGKQTDTSGQKLIEDVEAELTFQELKILRELAMSKAAPPVSDRVPSNQPHKSPAGDSRGVLKRWFPGWGGWYSAAEPEESAQATEETCCAAVEMPNDSSPRSATGSPPVKHPKLEIEERFMDVIADTAENNTLLKRDSVFARLNFLLKTGTCQLSDGSNTIFELEFSEVQMEFESRPRYNSSEIHITLGALYLRDMYTPNSNFGTLISPNKWNLTQREVSRKSSQDLKTPVKEVNLPAHTLKLPQGDVANDMAALFELTFEKNPLNSTADYRLVMKTTSLDTIYNPGAIKRIRQFFRTRSSTRQSALKLTEAARVRYEQLKMQTKAELQHTWDQLLEGEQLVRTKRWDAHLNISAPQIIVPESFQDPNTTVVVFDLGRLNFSTNSPDIETKQASTAQGSSDSDDEYTTPSSTPPRVPCDAPADTSGIPAEDAQPSFTDLQQVLSRAGLTKETLHSKMYDRYVLEMSELQVLVGRAKDNWKHAQKRGTGTTHVLDRFSISLQVERRILYTLEPQWPAVTLTGSLPKLVVHVNEQKIEALRKCIQLFGHVDSTNSVPMPTSLGDQQSPLVAGTSRSLGVQREVSELMKDHFLYQSTISLQKAPEHSDGEEKQLPEETRLLLANFSVMDLSLDIQSRSRSIAELQVSGVKANYMRRPYDSSVALTVHGLLLIDAIQTSGHDFELLVASHKFISVDSQSGSICDSVPTSPSEIATSRGSASSGPANVPKSDSMSAGVSRAASQSPTFPASYTPRLPLLEFVPDSDALIYLEFEQVSPRSPSNAHPNEQLQVATLTFNNLNVTANQETIVELLGFIQQVFPREEISKKLSDPAPTSEPDRSFLVASGQQQHNQIEYLTRTEVTANFHLLSILLPRAVTQDNATVGRKVAIATLSGARIQATISSSELQVQGSLGGVQLMDLTPEGSMHKEVFTVGHDPNVQRACEVPRPAHGRELFHSTFLDVGNSALQDEGFLHSYMPANMYRTAHESLLSTLELNDPTKAFTFKIVQPRADSTDNATVLSSTVDESRAATQSGDVVELTLRVASMKYTHSPRLLQELSSCVGEFRHYMDNVATTIRHTATDIAIGIVHKKPELLTQSLYLDTPSRRRHLSEEPDIFGNTFASESCDETDFDVRLDVVLQTPVIVLPRQQSSAEALVMHLGKIMITNVAQDNAEMVDIQSIRPDRIYVEVRDMNLYSKTVSADVVMAKQEDTKGMPILHDTTVELTIDRIPKKDVNRASHSFPGGFHADESSHTTAVNCDDQHVVEVTSKVVSPLMVVLSKQQYEQVLETLDNMTYNPANVAPPGDNVDLSDIDEDAVLEPSTSALKLDREKRKRSSIDPASSNGLDTAQFSPVYAQLQVPDFSVELWGNVGDGEQALVTISFQDFEVNMQSSEQSVTMLQVTLRALLMEDMLQPKDSDHKYIMVSNVDEELPDPEPAVQPSFVSISCPTSTQWPTLPDMPNSLPSVLLEPTNYFSHAHRKQVQRRSISQCKDPHPYTPPPSPTQSNPVLSGARLKKEEEEEADALVQISVMLVDKTHPSFAKKYNSTNRFFDINFNSLDTTINLQTWVMLLDFLGMGAKVATAGSPVDTGIKRSPSKMSSCGDVKCQTVINSEVELVVKSFTVVLNKVDYELARLNMSSLAAHISLRDGNSTMLGKLGSISVTDLTPHGDLYRERFKTVGDNALHFDVFKYGEPDPGLLREHDMRVKLRMSSVRILHTQRFQQETLAFCQHFTQLQDVLGRMRAASAGQTVSDQPTTSVRILLDIQAGSPVILIPHSARSTDILVADLGTLTVSNTFLKVGAPGTIAGLKVSADAPSGSGACQTAQDDPFASSTESQQSCDIDVVASALGYSFCSEANSASTPSLASYTGADARADTGADTGADAGSFSSTDAASRYNVMLAGSGTVVDIADSMTQSIYGSLDVDERQAEPLTLDANLATFDLIDFSEAFPRATPPTSGFSDSSYWMLPQQPPRLSGSSQLLSSLSFPARKPPENEARKQGGVNAATRAKSGKSHDTHGLHCSVQEHVCLLDVLQVELTDMDLYSAVRMSRHEAGKRQAGDLSFSTHVVRRKGGPLLERTCALRLQVERNLDADISHAAPGMKVVGQLSSVCCTIDLAQYKLLRGVLDHNLGEPLEDFEHQLNTLKIQEPQIQTVLSGEVWTKTSLHMELVNVTVALVMQHTEPSELPRAALAQLDFIKSKLSYESYSDNSKDIDLVSTEILVSDTRYRDAPANKRPNVFTNVLQPTRIAAATGAGVQTLQVEVHYRDTLDFTRLTVLLNNMRLMGIFDWLLAIQEFISTSADNPYASDALRTDAGRMSAATASVVSANPLTMATGILTKRMPVDRVSQQAFEVRVNITDTELVVVEDPGKWDTNAVILKATAVLSYRPQVLDKPLSLSLSNLEVFSCVLGLEEDSALSIIDPLAANVDINGKYSPSKSAGLLDVMQPPIDNTLEISINSLNVRLSFHDIMLFLAIANSIPERVQPATNSQSDTKLHYATEIETLTQLGFTELDCQMALLACGGHVGDAAMWLTENAVCVVTHNPHGFKIGVLEIVHVDLKVTGTCGICLIDDCKDSDVPLAEFNINGFHLNHHMELQPHGVANGAVTIDFYNRNLSGWEPVLEPWRTHVTWQQRMSDGSNAGKLVVAVESKTNKLNVNLTSKLLEQYSSTKDTWMEEYHTLGKRKDSEELRACVVAGDAGVVPLSGFFRVGQRRRLPFMAFTLHNNSGSLLRFYTQTATSSKRPVDKRQPHSLCEQQMRVAPPQWVEVPHGSEIPFSFDSIGKLRHRETHEQRHHQIIVAVEGWSQMSPVTVDKVGIYWRHAEPELSTTVYMEQVPARVVFDVRMEGSARKVVTVRSALRLVNKLEEQVEVRLQKAVGQIGATKLLKMEPNSSQSVPITHVGTEIGVRPISTCPLNFCSKPISWSHVMKPGDISDGMRSCEASATGADTYRFCVSVKSESYVAVVDGCGAPAHPGYTVTFFPPVVLVNLLPYDVSYYVKPTRIRGEIKPGRSAALTTVDISKDLELGLMLEGFPNCKELLIPVGTTNYVVRMHLYDGLGRALMLNARIAARRGGSLKVSVSALYWLVNMSGLPLVFKQDGVSKEAAGQFEEHEIARSVAPLLFSFVNSEAPNMCTMRIGKQQHRDSVPNWCQRFPLEAGTGVRQLHVVSPDLRRPHWVYNIGIDVHAGRGRYRDTNIVTFAPRFQLDNQTNHKLEFAQRDVQNEGNAERHLSAMPKSNLAFHWPRADKEQLLRVRACDIPGCLWSGGFTINHLESFHVNMRAKDGRSHFLRVEILTEGPTFFVVFSNADDVPPPFRIDNYSDVPIQYWQTKVVDDRLRSWVNARTSVPYAFDEPTLPPFITCSVSGGTSASYSLSSVGEASKDLCYENFLYIAVTSTFQEDPGSRMGAGVTSSELVLDVPQGLAVILARKQPGRRSQLWRMTSAAMLEHEGTSEPRDPRRPVAQRQSLVLDIDAMAPQPDSYARLMLRKPDERRRRTQTWSFTEDGRLCCPALPGLFVQVRSDIMRQGADVLLGRRQPVTSGLNARGIPIEQAIGRQKLRPGSGCLAVAIVASGPTRVLQVTDRMHNRLVSRPMSDWIIIQEHKLIEMDSPDADNKPQVAPRRDLEVHVVLSQGLGVSLVNHFSEELCYIHLTDIDCEYTINSAKETLNCSIRHIQVDNQLLGSQEPVLLHMTPNPRKDMQQCLPALYITACKIPSQERVNADIFEYLIMSIQPISLKIEERVLWKLLQFFGWYQSDPELVKPEESDSDTHRSLTMATSVHSKRYYFGMLLLDARQLRLSVLTSSKLPADLYAIKQLAGIPLIGFRDADIELARFQRGHQFETSSFLLGAIVKHYTESLQSQAAAILGSVDFLGNPLGLFNDVTEGLSGLISEGNVGGLLKNVAHGVSNSTARFTGSLSDTLGKVSMDDRHQEMREEIRAHSGSSGAHLKAGLKGLGIGVVGGLTSVFMQPIEGAARDGVGGLFTGLGKGLVGVVTKPTVGLLDMASGTAHAISKGSRSNSRQEFQRVRPTRCCSGVGGLLQCYSQAQAEDQLFLYSLNRNNYREMLVAYEQTGVAQQIHCLISSENVYFLCGPRQHKNIFLLVSMSELQQCHHRSEGCGTGSKHYIILYLSKKPNVQQLVDVGHPAHDQQSPAVECASGAVASKIAHKINYAKNLYQERMQTLMTDEGPDDAW